MFELSEFVRLMKEGMDELAGCANCRNPHQTSPPTDSGDSYWDQRNEILHTEADVRCMLYKALFDRLRKYELVPHAESIFKSIGRHSAVDLSIHRFTGSRILREDAFDATCVALIEVKCIPTRTVSNTFQGINRDLEKLIRLKQSFQNGRTSPPPYMAMVIFEDGRSGMKFKSENNTLEKFRKNQGVVVSNEENLSSTPREYVAS